MTMRYSVFSVTGGQSLAVAALALLMTVSAAWADCTQDTPPTCAYASAGGVTTHITPTAFNGPNPQCINVTNNCGTDIMVPFGSAAEWNSNYPNSFNTIYNNGQWDGGNSCMSVTQCPQNGACGTANGNTFTNLTATSSGLCQPGTVDNFQLNQNGSGWTWVCDGINGGNNSPTCSAAQQDGSCGNANGQTFVNAPPDGIPGYNLCLLGYSSTPSGGNGLNWSWQCTDDLSVTCTANDGYNGSCGTASGGTFSTLNSTSPNLCTGTVDNFVTTQDNNGNQTGWTWTCDGSGVDATSSNMCSATLGNTCSGYGLLYGACWYNGGLTHGATTVCDYVCSGHGGVSPSAGSLNDDMCMNVINTYFRVYNESNNIFPTGQGGCMSLMDAGFNVTWGNGCACNN